MDFGAAGVALAVAFAAGLAAALAFLGCEGLSSPVDFRLGGMMLIDMIRDPKDNSVRSYSSWLVLA